MAAAIVVGAALLASLVAVLVEPMGRRKLRSRARTVRQLGELECTPAGAELHTFSSHLQSIVLPKALNARHLAPRPLALCGKAQSAPSPSGRPRHLRTRSYDLACPIGLHSSYYLALDPRLAAYSTSKSSSCCPNKRSPKSHRPHESSSSHLLRLYTTHPSTPFPSTVNTSSHSPHDEHFFDYPHIRSALPGPSGPAKVHASASCLHGVHTSEHEARAHSMDNDVDFAANGSDSPPSKLGPQAHEYHMTEHEKKLLLQMRSEVCKRKDELSREDIAFASDACLARYLRARKWDVRKATEFFFESLSFRRRYRPESIMWEDIASEAETGKIYRMYKDRSNRPVILMRPGRENSKDYTNQMRCACICSLLCLLSDAMTDVLKRLLFYPSRANVCSVLIFNLEHSILQMETNDLIARGSHVDLSPEQMTWLVDFKGWSMAKAVPLSVALETKDVLQKAYPERLGAALFWNPPKMFERFYKMIAPFIEPDTRGKIHFVRGSKPEAMRHTIKQLFETHLVEKSLGGGLDYEYDLEKWGEQMKYEDSLRVTQWKEACSDVDVC